MVWCTCSQGDDAHPESSRLMALDAWVVEHCRGESLDDYEGQGDEEEDEDEEEDSSAKVDAMCMTEALVVRAGPNTLPKPVPLRQLLSGALVAQGGNKRLKGASFWVYWYDQPIPTPSAPEYAGMGRVWAPGPLSRKDLGVWYRARITKCDTATGEVKVKYDIDNSQDSMYLLVAFAHFDTEPPARGLRPEVLPDMDLVESLGLPQSTGASGSASAGGKGKGRGAAAAAAPKKASAAAVAAKPPQTNQQTKGAGHDKHAGRAATAAAPAGKPTATAAATKPTAAAPAGKPMATAAATKPTAAAPPPSPAQAAGSLQRAPSSTSAALPAAAEAGGCAAAKPTDASKPLPFKIKPPSKRASSPPVAAPPLPPKHPSSKQPQKPAETRQALKEPAPAHRNTPAAPAAPPSASVAAAAPPPGPGSRAGPAVRPAKRPRHEFELVPLSSVDSRSASPAASAAAAAAAAWPPPKLSAAAWEEREAKARSRPRFLGLLCGKQELVPVPVFNEVDSAPPPASFEYVSAASFEGRLAGDLAEARRRQPAVAAALDELQGLCDLAQPRWGQPCGQGYNDAVRQQETEERGVAAGGGAGGAAPEASPESTYGPDGRLLAMRPLGVHECSPACSSPRCRANMTLTRGVHRPLEVFRGRDGAWSLRCPEPLEPGDFVAPLLGRVVAAQALMEELAGAGAGDTAVAAGRLPGPPGVVLLNHFFALWEAAYTRGLNWCDRHVRLWQLPPNPLAFALPSHNGDGGRGRSPAAGSGGGAAADDPARPAVRRLACMLALDTRHVGNVARFVRQWAPPPPQAGGAAAAATSAPLPLGPALVAQPVLAGACRSPLLYYVGLFAARRVEAGEELSCDFSAMALTGSGPGGVAGPAR